MMKVKRVGKADFGCPLDDEEIGYDTCLPMDAPEVPLKACRRVLLFFLEFLDFYLSFWPP